VCDRIGDDPVVRPGWSGAIAPPYQDVLSYLGVVEGVSTAFLDRSVRARRAASRRRTAGDVTDESCLLSDP